MERLGGGAPLWADLLALDGYLGAKILDCPANQPAAGQPAEPEYGLNMFLEPGQSPGCTYPGGHGGGWRPFHEVFQLICYKAWPVRLVSTPAESFVVGDEWKGDFWGFVHLWYNPGAAHGRGTTENLLFFDGPVMSKPLNEVFNPAYQGDVRGPTPLWRFYAPYW